MSFLDVSLWKEAINSHYKSIIQNNIWSCLIYLQKNKSIGCKWVFRKKFKLDKSANKYKTRLETKDFTHRKNLVF